MTAVPNADMKVYEKEMYGRLWITRALVGGIVQVKQGGVLSQAGIRLQQSADQFQPREFSAIMGPEICCVRAELLPLVPLPLLFLSWLDSPGEVRPPDMTA